MLFFYCCEVELVDLLHEFLSQISPTQFTDDERIVCHFLALFVNHPAFMRSQCFQKMLKALISITPMELERMHELKTHRMKESILIGGSEEVVLAADLSMREVESVGLLSKVRELSLVSQYFGGIDGSEGKSMNKFGVIVESVLVVEVSPGPVKDVFAVAVKL